MATTRRQQLLEKARKAQAKQTGGHSRPVPATTKQETGSYYGTKGSSGRVSGKVMPAHTTQKEKAASAASKLAKQAATYKAAHRRNDMAGMISAAGGNMAKLKSIHAAAYPSGSSLPKKNGAAKTTVAKTTATRLTPAQRRRQLLARYGGPLRARQG